MLHNGRAPIKASRMRPEHLNLREGETPLAVCPDCESWHRLTRSMISPHRDSSDKPAKTGGRRYYGDKPERRRRCPGSAQRITIDLTPEQWGQALLAADSTATGRRSARQHHKPIQAPATPVTRMAPAPPHAADVLAAYSKHLKECRKSGAPGHCDQTRRCVTGFQLAAQYDVLSRGQDKRDSRNRKEARVDALITRHRAGVAARRAATQWAKQYDGTGAPAALAKRSGTAIEDANNTCRTRPADTVSDYRGPSVPETPVRITA
ncbi:hypothetical protein ACFVHR_15100 [Streptomyces sp. NPDC127168]|uniref:hypothetical protein n=1 Tax=unclassified Streptomyces TaxID=2593676 RepID=UPI003636751B